MFVNFSEETKHLLKQAEAEKDNLNHPYVGSEHLLLSILKDSKLTQIFKKHRITYDKFKQRLISLVGVGSKQSDFILYTPLLKRVLENSVIEAKEDNNKNVTPEMLIISILDEEDGVAYTILKSMKVNIDKLYFDIKNNRVVKNNKRKKLLLDELGTDMTKLAKNKMLDPVIGREKEVSRTIEILLRRKKNNPILIGPAGVGKTAIVEGISNLIISNKCPKYLKDKKMIALNMFQLVSGTKYRGEFEEKMKLLIKELEENQDVILFIDEIHTMVGAGGAEGAVDASNILKPALARGTIKIIGATTTEEYKKFIEPDAALARRFQSVLVEEPNFENVIKILKGIKPLYEKYHNILIPDELLKDIAALAGRYLINRAEPDRSIDILDEVCARSSATENYEERRKNVLEKRLEKIKKEKLRALSNKDFKRAYELKNDENNVINNINNIKNSIKKVNKDDVLQVIKEKGNIKIPFGDENQNAFYENIECMIKKEVIGQDENIRKLIMNFRIKNIAKNKKCYSALIMGKKNSGKKLLVNTFIKSVFNKNSIIKIDLSEYTEHHMISKLLGTTAGYLGYDNKNNIFEKVRTNPSTALIVSNFERGCIEVQSLFIKILTEGKVQDSSGKEIDFTNGMIFFIEDKDVSDCPVGFNSNVKEDFSFLPDELTNNVSTIIAMKELNEEDKKTLLNKKIGKVIKKYENFKISVDDNYLNKILFKLQNAKNNINIDTLVQNEFESKVIDGIIKKQSEILVKSDVIE